MIRTRTQWQNLRGQGMTSFNLRVREIVVFKEKIYGLTEEGHLAFFDEATGKWIRRSSPDVINPEDNEVIKCSFIDEKPSLIVPRHSRPVESELSDKASNVSFWISAFFGINLTALAVYLLCRYLFP